MNGKAYRFDGTIGGSGRGRGGAARAGRRGRVLAVTAVAVALGLTATACGGSSSYKKSCDLSTCTVKVSGAMKKRKKVLGSKMRVRDVTPDMLVHVDVGSNRGSIRVGETATIGNLRVSVVSATGADGTKKDKAELKVVRA